MILLACLGQRTLKLLLGLSELTLESDEPLVWEREVLWSKAEAEQLLLEEELLPQWLKEADLARVLSLLPPPPHNSGLLCSMGK